MNSSSKKPSIAIIGAGPAGLLTAHYLRQRGYGEVFVLEKLGRVGGLCKTVTKGNHSFDLGANYIVPSYREVLKLAKQLGAEMYSERPFVAIELPRNPANRDEHVTYSSIFSATRQTEDGKLIPLFTFFSRILKYVWLRFRMRQFINKPTFAGVEHYRNGELAVPMDDWLASNNLTELRRVFDLPITMMGFGHLKKTPAIYALKFMELKAFVPMLLKETPVVGRFISWPKRFVYGYGRLWEKLSWNLNVRTGVHISRITRKEQQVEIEYAYPDQALNELDWQNHKLVVDYLILACPLRQFADDSSILTLNNWERENFPRIEQISYCMTTRTVSFTKSPVQHPLGAIYP